MVALGGIGAVFLLVYLFNKILKSMNLNILTILGSFFKNNMLTISLCICLGAVVIYFISYMVSVAFMKKREF